MFFSKRRTNFRERERVGVHEIPKTWIGLMVNGCILLGNKMVEHDFLVFPLRKICYTLELVIFQF